MVIKLNEEKDKKSLYQKFKSEIKWTKLKDIEFEDVPNDPSNLEQGFDSYKGVRYQVEVPLLGQTVIDYVTSKNYKDKEIRYLEVFDSEYGKYFEVIDSSDPPKSTMPFNYEYADELRRWFMFYKQALESLNNKSPKEIKYKDTLIRLRNIKGTYYAEGALTLPYSKEKGWFDGVSLLIKGSDNTNKSYGLQSYSVMGPGSTRYYMSKDEVVEAVKRKIKKNPDFLFKSNWEEIVDKIDKEYDSYLK